MRIGREKFLTFGLLAVILTLAVFFRFWSIADIPPGLWPDEALNANQAVAAWELKDFKAFYPENHGREGLYINILAVVFGLFGVSVASFKAVSAVAGVLTVLGLYLFAFEVLRNLDYDERTARSGALLSSFLLAISFWHINFSRIGFRAILVPLVLTFSAWLILKAFREKRTVLAALAGIIFGLGFYTYISFRAAVIPFALLLIFLRPRRIVLAFLLAVFVVALPLGLYFLEHPQDFIARSSGVSVLSQENPLTLFGESLAKHLLMFNFTGDPNWRHNLANWPQLGIVAGVFFLVGLIALLKRLRRYVGAVSLFLLVWLGALLLPSILTFEGIPHALRSIGVTPVVYLLAGLGGVLTFNWLTSRGVRREFIGLFLILLTTVSFYTYFLFWGQNLKVADAFTVKFTEVGETLNSLPLKTRKYVIMSEGELPTEVPRFIQKTAGRDEAVYIINTSRLELKPGDVLLTMNEHREPLKAALRRYPNSQLTRLNHIWLAEIK